MDQMTPYDPGLAREVAEAQLPEALSWALEDASQLTPSQVRALRDAAGNQLASLDFDIEDWSEGSPGTRLEDLIGVLADYLPEMDGPFAASEAETPGIE
jgi:hypothetical protein